MKRGFSKIPYSLEYLRETTPYLKQTCVHSRSTTKVQCKSKRNLFDLLGEMTEENKALFFFSGGEAN